MNHPKDMAEKQPLLAGYPLDEQQIQLPQFQRTVGLAIATGAAERSRLRRARIFVLLKIFAAFTAFWLLFHPRLHTIKRSVSDDWDPLDEQFALPGFDNTEWSSPLDYTFDESIVFCQGINKTFIESNTTLSYNISTTADKIQLFSRGFVSGNITIDSAKTAGDDIEVDITFLKPEDDVLFDDDGDDNGSDVGLVRPSGPPPLKVSICTVKDEGTEAVAIIALPDFKHHHHPPGGPHHRPGHDDSSSFPEYKISGRPKAPPKPPHKPKPPKKGPKAPPKRVQANIAVRLPESSSLRNKKDKTLKIKHFESKLPGFKHLVGDLDVAFDVVELVGHVVAKAISAIYISVRAPWGGISGDFSASRAVELLSWHGDIDGNVELWSDSSEQATRFGATSPAGSVTANVSLKAYDTSFAAMDEDKETFHPSYVVKTFATESTQLDFTDQPVNSSLVAEVSSKVHPVSVKLHPAYEGFFEAVSLFGKPTVIVTDETSDPSGEKRKRVVKFFRSWRWVVKGYVTWAKESVQSGTSKAAEIAEDVMHHHGGVVKLFTSRAPAILILG